MTTTPANIIEAALAYNAAYPEAAAEILDGTPELVISVVPCDTLGRTYRYVRTFGVRLPDGGFAAAEEPRVAVLDKRDGRTSPLTVASGRFGREADAAGVRYVVLDRR